jgi:hypothetical protein
MPVPAVRDAVKKLRPDAGVAQKNLEAIPRRRVTLLSSPYIFCRVFKPSHNKGIIA